MFGTVREEVICMMKYSEEIEYFIGLFEQDIEALSDAIMRAKANFDFKMVKNFQLALNDRIRTVQMIRDGFSDIDEISPSQAKDVEYYVYLARLYR